MPESEAPTPTVGATGRILLVDDETALLRALTKILELAGHSVTAVASGAEAIAQVRSTAFDVVVSDIRMPNMNGLALLRAIRATDLDVPVVFLTGSPSLESAVEALEYGAYRYLTKPVDSDELRAAVARAVSIRRLAAARRAAADQFHGRALGDRASLDARFASAVATRWIATQPILSWRTQSVYAYEALLRTEEPTLMEPLDVLEAAERLGRTQELGRLIRRSIADQLITLPPSVPVFVNLHPSDLVDEELASPDGALTPFAHGVVLEITERAGLDEFKGVAATIGRLRELGFRIAIDDLGAGYAGLSTFALLEPEVVKVDVSLVRDIHRSPTKQKLFRSFASMCRDMNTELVAEGVEQVAERDCLTELGGDLYQGFLFARPGQGFPSPRY